MNDEQSVVADDHEENALNDAAVPNEDQEDVRPPDSKRFQLEMDEIMERIRDSEKALKSLEKEIMSSSSSSRSKAIECINRDKLHVELQDFRAQREKVIEERKQFDVELKGLNMQVQKKNDACTKLQAGVRYKSETRIDEAVRRLEHQMQAQQLTLSEEKRLVAEINILKRSKRNLNDYLALKQQVDQMRNKQKKIRGQRDGCVKRINGLKSREEEIKNLLESNATDGSEDTATKHLEKLNEIEVLKKELDELHIKKRELRTNFTKERDEYYSAIREMRSQKQKEEFTRRKQERLATLKDVSRTRSKQQPYEKEKALCDTLMSHLEKMHKTSVHIPEEQVSSVPDKEPVISPSADFSMSDGEGTFLKRKSTTDDLVGVFAGIARTPRRGSRKGRRPSTKEVPRKLNLHPEVVEHLLALSLSPPSTAADIPKVLEELQEKKHFYERAVTTSTMLAPPSNDAMSPITEEAAPQFPSSLEDSSKSENPEEAIQAEHALSASESTIDEDDNPHENHNEVSLTSSKEEEIMLSEVRSKIVDEPKGDSLNGILSETEGSVAGADLSLPHHLAPCNKNSVIDPEGAVSNSKCKANAAESDSAMYNLNSTDKLYSEQSEVSDTPCPVNGDMHLLDEVVTNSEMNDKGSDKREEKMSCSDNNHIKAEVIPKEGNFIPDLQHHFTSSSPRNSSMLLDENGLEAAYDRNSLNESGSLVQVQCEKCPA